MTKFFVTGGTGHIGQGLVDELLSHGYQVLGLARSDASAEQLTKKGAEVLRGSLEDLDILKKGAKETDGTLHLAFIHDFANFAKSAAIDYDATNAIIDALEGSGKVFLWTSGLGSIPTEIGVKATEDDSPNIGAAPPDFRKRLEAEQLVSEAGKTKNIRSAVIRLPPSVHGKGDYGFVPILTKTAKENGVVLYADEGKTTWPAVHKKDAAVLYRLAAEKGEAGKVYHGAAEEGVETKLIAEAIAKKTGLKTQSTNLGELGQKAGVIGYFFGTNIYSSSEKTRKALGWVPKELGLIEDIDKNYPA